RLLLRRPVSAQIVEREDPAAGADAVDDRRAELPFVQDARAIARDGLERARERGLHELVGWLRADGRTERRAGRAEEDAPAVAGPVQPLVVHGERQAHVPVDLEAVARDADRRLHDALSRQASVALVRE